MQRNVVLVVLAIALAGLLGLLAWLIGQGILTGDRDGEVQARSIESGGALAGTGTESNAQRPAVKEADRRALHDPDNETLAPEVILAGRCLDEQDQPLAGVEIELAEAEGTPPNALDLYRFQHPDMIWDDPPMVVHSGADGRFELRLRTPAVYRGWHLQVRAAGRVPLEQYPDELTAGRHDLGDIRLRKGCLLTGAVRDSKGRPHAGVRVFLDRDIDWDTAVVEQNWVEACTAADGTFRVPEPVAPAKWEVRIHGALLPVEKPLVLDLTGKASHQLLILVRDFEDVDKITGWVVNEAGQPMVSSSVHFEPTGDYRQTWWSKIDATGRFLVQRRQRDPEGKVTLLVTGRGRPTHRVPGVEWNAEDVRIEVPSPPELELVVREAGNGRPVEHYGVIHQEEHPKLGFGSLKGLCHVGRHPEGRTRIPNLPHGRHRFTVVPRDPGLAWSEAHDVRVDDRLLAPVIVELPKRGARPVRIVDASGQAVSDVRLQLLRPGFVGRKERLFVIDPLRTTGASGASLALVEQVVVTDAGGGQVLRANPTCRYILRVRPPDHLPRVLWEVIPDGRFGELRIVLDQGCMVRGRVQPLEIWDRLRSRHPVPEKGEEPDVGFMVVARRRSSSVARPDASGCFEISGLPPGSARLLMTWYRRVGEGLEREVTTVHRWADLPAGKPADVVVDLRPFRPVQVHGLVTHNGRPLSDERISVGIRQEVGGVPRWVTHFRVKTDADGRFACEGLPGQWRAFWSPLTALAGPVTIDSRSVELAFASGGLKVLLQRDDGTPVTGIQVSATQKKENGDTHRLPRSDTDGRAGLSRVLPGEYDLWMWPKSLERSDARRKAIGSDPSAARKARVQLSTVMVVGGSSLEHRVIVPVKAGY